MAYGFGINSGNRRSVVIGSGRYEPSVVVHNEDLQKYVGGLTDNLFRALGIQERRWVFPLPTEHESGETDFTPKLDPYRAILNPDNEAVQPLRNGQVDYKDALKIFGRAPDTIIQYLAVQELLRKTDYQPNSIGKVYSTTSTPDDFSPNAGEVISDWLGLHGPALSTVRGCAGFLEALKLADAEIRSGDYGSALIVGSNMTSSQVRTAILEEKNKTGKLYVPNHSDRLNAALFGDGAAAILLQGELGDPQEKGIFAWLEGTDGSKPLAWYPGGSRIPPTEDYTRGQMQYWKLRSAEIQDFGPITLRDAIVAFLEKTGIKLEDIGKILLHPGNGRMFRRTSRLIAERLGVQEEEIASRAPYILPQYGNLSTAGIPMLIDMYWNELTKDSRKHVLGTIGAGADYSVIGVRF